MRHEFHSGGRGLREPNDERAGAIPPPRICRGAGATGADLGRERRRPGAADHTPFASSRRDLLAMIARWRILMGWRSKSEGGSLASGEIENVLGRSLHVHGDLKADGAFRIDGTVDGAVESKA